MKGKKEVLVFFVSIVVGVACLIVQHVVEKGVSDNERVGLYFLAVVITVGGALAIIRQERE